MTYEEKRELRLQISQLLADAGLNQKVIKELVENEIRNKVNRAVEQTIKSLNSECSSGDFFEDRVVEYVNSYMMSTNVREAVRKELSNKIISVTLKDCEMNK